MSLIINHNLMAANAARNLGTVFGRLSTSTQRLSSGLRINSAADDAAGLAIRELMRADIAVINQGIRNASDAISMIQTAEGAMSVIDEKLIRMKELAEQAATGTYTTAQRQIMNSEYQAMAAEIDRIATATEFNGVKLLDGSLNQQHLGSGLKVHFGTGNDAAEDYYYINIDNMRATSSTGLRVGSSAQDEVFQTTALDLNSTSELLATATSDTGVFGVQYSSDSGATWSDYGYVTVDSDDTLTSMVGEINQGNAEAGSLTLGATATSGNLAGDTLTVNGYTFTFSTANNTITATTIGILAGGFSTISTQVITAVNTYASVTSTAGTEAFAHMGSSTTVISFINEELGANGAAALSSNGTGVTAVDFNGGGSVSWITASTQIDDTGKYELRLSATPSATSYGARQVRITSPDGSILNATGSNTTLNATANTTLALTGVTTREWSAVDDATDWEQVSHGSGNADWAGANILTQSASQVALGALDGSINIKDTARASLGALQNRLENTITNLQIQAENLQAAEAAISDVDVALEMTEFTKNNIMAQAAVAMLAQANSLPMMAMQLIG